MGKNARRARREVGRDEKSIGKLEVQRAVGRNGDGERRREGDERSEVRGQRTERRLQILDCRMMKGARHKA